MSRQYVAIYRCSSNVQTEKSIPDQQMIVEEFARKHDIIAAGNDIIQAGVSASRNRYRDDIDELIDRKKMRNDFDTVLIHDFSRLTRRGYEDGVLIEKSLRDAGITVISATEPIPDGPYSGTIKTMLYTHANEYVRGNAHRTARGQMSALLNGTNVGTHQPTYGIDRLYTAKSDGSKRHRVRGLPDGSQSKLHPETEEVQAHYEYVKGQRSRFYRKQPDENVTLVPGDKTELEVVRRIFREAIVEGVGYHLIARRLNDDGVPAARGGKWHKAAVARILATPLYTGRIIANRQARALYWKRGKDGPIAVTPNDRPANSGGVGHYRPKEDWITVPMPALQNILDPKLLELAIPYVDDLLEYKATKLGKRGLGKDKHSKSSFFLKDVLKLRADGRPMCGSVADRSSCGKGIYRYYRARGCGEARYVKTQVMKRIPAEPLELIVRDILFRVFAEFPNQRDLVKAAVLKEQALRHEAKTRLHELEKQRNNIKKKIACFADFAGEITDEWMVKVQNMKDVLQNIDAKLRVAQSETVIGDPDEITDGIMREMFAIGEELPKATMMVLRRILMVLVGKMEVDLGTRELWLTVRLPSWALLGGDGFTMDRVCLGSCVSPYPLPEAKHQTVPNQPQNQTELPALDSGGLVLAEARSWTTKRTMQFPKKTQPLHWRFVITDGIVTAHEPQMPNSPPMPLVDAEIDELNAGSQPFSTDEPILDINANGIPVHVIPPLDVTGFQFGQSRGWTHAAA